MSWITIAKPSGSIWTAINGQGREQYDQSDIEYDDADTFYDGVNNSAWTNIAKPVSSTWTKISKPT